MPTKCLEDQEGCAEYDAAKCVKETLAYCTAVVDETFHLFDGVAFKDDEVCKVNEGVKDGACFHCREGSWAPRRPIVGGDKDCLPDVCQAAQQQVDLNKIVAGLELSDTGDCKKSLSAVTGKLECKVNKCKYGLKATGEAKVTCDPTAKEQTFTRDEIKTPFCVKNDDQEEKVVDVKVTLYTDDKCEKDPVKVTTDLSKAVCVLSGGSLPSQ